MRRLAIVVLLLALATVGCSSSDPEAAPAPSPSVLETTTTVGATTSTAKPTTTTTGVPRTTTTTVLAMGPGNASIGGTVSGPAGPAEGAIVRVERLVGKAVATTDVTTAAGGSWQLGSILGGSYRVRAFRAPDLAPSQVEAFFLGATERRTLDFKLAAAGAERISAVVSPNPPRVEQSATITITVGIGRVDDQGRAALTPRPGLVLVLADGPGLQLESAPGAVTDANGAASWRFRCTTEGEHAFPLTVGTGITQVKIPACGPPGPTTTTRPG